MHKLGVDCLHSPQPNKNKKHPHPMQLELSLVTMATSKMASHINHTNEDVTQKWTTADEIRHTVLGYTSKM